MHKTQVAKHSLSQQIKAAKHPLETINNQNNESILNQISLALLVLVCAAPESIALFEVNSYTLSLLLFSPIFVLQLHTAPSD